MKKQKTNVDLVKDLMNYSPYGSLGQAFIIQAIQNYCNEIAAWEPNEKEKDRSLINCDTWKKIGEDVQNRINEFYGTNN